jgi:hypothetical protein
MTPSTMGQSDDGHIRTLYRRILYKALNHSDGPALRDRHSMLILHVLARVHLTSPLQITNLAQYQP